MDVGSYCTGGSWTTQHARQRAAEGGLEEPLYVLTCDAFFLQVWYVWPCCTCANERTQHAERGAGGEGSALALCCSLLSMFC